MFSLEPMGWAILIASALVMVSVLAGLVASRTGLPLLLIFLVIGMLAGENGPGGIVFDDHRLAFWFGNVALAVILLDGGLRTQMSTFRVALKPSLVLATLGVVLSCVILAALLHWVTPLSWPHALLIGAIVSSTDAAAVFSLLGGAGIRLNERISATLEIESGLNDPMAVFLTLVAIGLVAGGMTGFGLSDFATALIKQAGLGWLVAYGGYFAFAKMLKWLKAESAHNPGLGAILLVAGGLVLYGASTAFGGSGFLTVYLFGLFFGNRRSRYVKTVIPAMDGLAWLSQACMFLLLGLLATPARFLDNLWVGIAAAFVLMFIARPLAVWISLLPFRFGWKESTLISWVGLRGAVPIILAIFPIMAGVDPDRTMMHLALMVVIASLVFQGWSLGYVAKRLDLLLPDQADPIAQRKAFGDFGLLGSAVMRDIADFYGLSIQEHEYDLTLSEWTQQHLGKPAVIGDQVHQNGLCFTVTSLDKTGGIERVGIKADDPKPVAS
ncbi:MAG: antiporter NhaP [Pseudomonadota bacterium]|jgi:cell volume regulation protein A